MADDMDTKDDLAQDDDVNDDQNDDVNTSNDTGNDKPKTFGDMSPDQVQSWFGRINKEQITKQFDEKVMPVLEEMRAGSPATDATPPDEDMQNMMFTNPDKFFEIGMEKYQKKVKNVTDTKLKSIDEAILTYAEDPLYRDIHSEMKKIAHDKVGEGWPPQAAVIYAKSEAEKNHLKRQAGDDTDLEMLSGGGALSRKKTKTLPPKLKEACARDIRDGIIKDEKDFINSMSPKLREIYGV